ncbi:GntR family transcriptional regulator [Phytohabitans sp. ZYX-F-186]|uniref:GntR family transcriptional regulator n=1 Tax=Phytohabitans maris TaxID=3071409 RepID=A0ABU0ZTE9_9ACTN|nr:GntR family transcriptional regulator [Phytohabitans sp. ZYX-F-186]MDQ7909485.1 GntR family transcriptional regulator [Phytohabitans sp. ZYX-F-186]
MTLTSLAPIERGAGAGGTGDRVRDALVEAILAGALPPGTHLNADALAKRLGVSHIPVREALRSLGADGWIDYRPHLGAYVRERSEQELADLFEARLEIEGRTTAMAAERRTAEQLAALDAILARQAGAADPVVLAALNAEFHIAVAACSQNHLMAGFVRALSLRARFYFSAVAPSRRQASLADHRAIVDALRRRDAAEAERLGRSHVASTRRDLHRALTAPPPATP